ncbi:MAG: RNA polymerase sigma factor, partial [Aeoliella sp.]
SMISEATQLWMERLTGEEPVRGAALSELRELLAGRLLKSLRHRPDVATAALDDIVQEAQLKILENLDQFEGRSQFTTWATTIAMRTAYSELRKRRWKDVSLEQVLNHDQGADNLAVDTEATPAATSDKAGLVADMYRVIQEELTPKQREALLTELKGMPLQEIARNTGSTPGAVYKLTHDARKRLKRGLEELGYSSEDWYSMRT